METVRSALLSCQRSTAGSSLENLQFHYFEFPNKTKEAKIPYIGKVLENLNCLKIKLFRGVDIWAYLGYLTCFISEDLVFVPTLNGAD